MTEMHRIERYAVEVVEGRITAGKLQKLACERFLNDLKASELVVFNYRFDYEKADHILNFAETLVIAEGNEKKPLELADFQAFILGNINGWVDKTTGYRRFRSSYIQLGRQQGKSILNGILAAYYGNFDGYNFGQIYCTATKQDQARIVLNEVIKFIRSDEDLEELFKIKEYASTIECKLTNSTIKALGRDTKSIDGFRPYLGIVDEYHAHKDNQMYKQLEGGTGNLKECLISVITTAGFTINGPCHKLYDYCVNLLKGVFKNETQFVFITQMDDEDDIWDSNNWVKANPLTCQTQEGIERMLDIAIKAKEIGGEELRDFMTKRLNTWVTFSNNQYIDMDKWKLGATDKTLQDFISQSCVVGLDLSSGGDLTSLALVFPKKSVEDKYYIYSHSFIPSKRVAEHIKTDNVPYDIWIKEGLLTVTETLSGVKTDYKYIISHLKRLIEEYELDIKVICYDPHNASAFLNDLEELGIDTLMITQSARNLNDATVDFRLEVEAESVEYDRKNELLSWSIINAKTVSNSFGEIKIDKEFNTSRIDPVDAILDAWKVAMTNEYEVSITEVTNEYLDMMGW